MIAPSDLTPLAFLLVGLAASTHCAVMCGPVMAMMSRDGRWDSLLTLQLGRWASYTALGATVAWLGSLPWVAEHRSSVEHWRMAGLSVVLLALLIRVRPHQKCSAGAAQASLSQSQAFMRGAAIGLVPCPILLSILGYAFMVGNPADAAISMLAFGAGNALPLVLVARGLNLNSGILQRQPRIAAAALVGALMFSLFMPYALPLIQQFCLPQAF